MDAEINYKDEAVRLRGWIEQMAAEYYHHWNGYSPEFSSSYHHSVIIPGIIHKALEGCEVEDLHGDELSYMVDGFMREKTTRPKEDYVLNLLREKQAELIKLRKQLEEIRKRSGN